MPDGRNDDLDVVDYSLDVASLPGDIGLARTLDLWWSNGFFNLAYALPWVAFSSYAAFLERPS